MSHTKINHEIQALRGIAVILVVAHHLGGLFFWAPLPWAQIGRGFWVGVDLFFCISGYVIAKELLPRLLHSSGSDFWREVAAFWIRRLYRISPSAWLWLALPMLLSPFFVHLPSIKVDDANLADIASALLHVTNFRYFKCTAEATQCGLYAQYWSLSLEEQFYIALPFIVYFSRRHLVYVLWILITLQIFLTRIHWQSPTAFFRTDALLLGVLLALFSVTDIYKLFTPRLERSYLRFFVPPVLLACLLAVTRYEFVTFYVGLAAVVATLMVWLCSYDKGYFIQHRILLRILSWVGERSYAIYLAHFTAFGLTREIWARLMPVGFEFNGTFNVRFATTALILILVFAEVNLRLIERPLRKIGKGHSDKLLAKTAAEQLG